jgi:origin recognition complex subunit 2
MLWNSALLKAFRWLYHDATTFEPYTVELDVVEDVNQLLGRGRRRLGGKDGVAYVLKSLPENARNLFRILVAEQLALMEVEPSAVAGAAVNGYDDDIIGDEDEEVAAREQGTPSKRGRVPKAMTKPSKPARRPAVSAPEGVEYRTLYNKAVEEFVCSSELNFRTLLKEFHDHQMIESRKDAVGTERLIVPFGKEELEVVLEELV